MHKRISKVSSMKEIPQSTVQYRDLVTQYDSTPQDISSVPRYKNRSRSPKKKMARMVTLNADLKNNKKQYKKSINTLSVSNFKKPVHDTSKSLNSIRKPPESNHQSKKSLDSLRQKSVAKDTKSLLRQNHENRSITDNSFIKNASFIQQTKKTKQVLLQMNRNLGDKQDYVNPPSVYSSEPDRRIFKTLGAKKTRNLSKVSFKFEDKNY